MKYKKTLDTISKNMFTKLLLTPKTALNSQHVDLAQPASWTKNKQLAGQAVKRIIDKEGNKKLQVVEKESYNKLNILAFGGIDFDSPRHMAALNGSIERFLSKYHRPAETSPRMTELYKSIEALLSKHESLEYAAIYPNATRKERYNATTEYSLSSTKMYYPPYIEYITRTFILPRFVSKTLSELQEPEHCLTLYSFSVGGREIGMIEHCLRSIFFKEYKATPEDVHELFGYINALSLAYAMDHDNLPKEPRFAKTIIFSVDDIGVLRPASVAEDIERFDPASADKPAIYNNTLHAKLSYPTYIFYLGHGVVPKFYKDEDGGIKKTTDGHTLPNYVEGIKDHPELYLFALQTLGDVAEDSVD